VHNDPITFRIWSRQVRMYVLSTAINHDLLLIHKLCAE